MVKMSKFQAGLAQIINVSNHWSSFHKPPKQHSTLLTFCYSLVPLFCIIANEFSKVRLLDFLHNLNDQSHNSITLYNIEPISAIWLGLSIIFSIVLGAISDRFHRKAILVLTVCSSFLADRFLQSGFIWTGVVVSGVLGNITPIARAAYCDIHIVSGRYPNIINTFIAQAIPWILIPVSGAFFDKHNLLTTTFFSISALVASLFFFKDFRDKHQKTDKSKKSQFYRPVYARILLALLIWNSCWHIIIYYNETNVAENIMNDFILFAGLAFLAGNLITKYYRFRAGASLSFIFLITFLLFFFDWIVASVMQSPTQISPNAFLLLTLIGGAGLPMIYIFFGEKAKIHQLGRVYGSLEAVQSLTEFLGPFTLSLVPLASLNYGLLLPAFLISFFISFNAKHPDALRA